MRLPLRLDSVRRFLIVGMPLGCALLAWPVLRGFDICAVAAVLLFAVLCEIYMFCFTLVIGSVSVATLVALRSGAVDDVAFARRANGAAMVEVRLGRLLDIGMLEMDGVTYRLTAKGLRLHRFFSALRRFFGHELA